VKLVEDILAKVDHLPGMPAIVQQILATVSEPDFEFQKVVDLVRLDQGITADVLRICNSPYYGLHTKMSSLEQAIAYLGANQIVEIVLSSKVVGHFKKAQYGYRLPKGELWRHSMATALLAQKIGERLKFADLPTLFTAALLHDLGKLILSEYVGEQFDEIEDLVKNHGMSFVEAERKVLGVDHALLGAAVARKWNLPEPITYAIAFHHNLEPAKKHRDIVLLVSLANLMVVHLGIGSGAQGLAAPVPQSLLQEVGLKSRDLDKISLELKDILDQADELLSLAR
jgi:putative nucleotidyltransferase with HDIG domain